MNSWENNLRKEFGEPITKINLKRILLEKIDSSTFLKKNTFSKFAQKILEMTSSQTGVISIYARNLFSRFFEFDPLNAFPRDEINVFLLVAEKDLKLLPYSLVAVTNFTSNPISSVSIVFPSRIEKLVRERMHGLINSVGKQINFVSDEEVLELNNLNKEMFENSYSKMQVLKLCIPLISNGENLIVDADTIILRERNWVSGVTQISPIAQEYQIGYNTFAIQTLKKNKVSGLGFVTHHGLLRSTTVKKMVEDCGGISKLANKINEGIKRGWDTEYGFPSEWQLYGEYNIGLSGTYRSIPASFMNLGLTRNLFPVEESPTYENSLNLVNRIKTSVPNLGSLSLHSYKDS